MSKSQRLRSRDLRSIYRLIGECRDLGADPLVWQRRLVEGISTLVGARVAHAGVPIAFPGPPSASAGMVHVGLNESAQSAAFEEWFRFLTEGGVIEEPFLQRFAPLWSDRLITRSISQLLSRNEWHRAETFQTYHRRMNLDPGIMSLSPVLGEIYSLSARRSLGERPFSLREVRLVHWLHHELAREMGRTLAPVGEPSASELPPRMRQTLQYLLDGLSEKQIARRMGISRPTVHEYVTGLYRRFGASSRGELMARWIRYGTGAPLR